MASLIRRTHAAPPALKGKASKALGPKKGPKGKSVKKKAAPVPRVRKKQLHQAKSTPPLATQLLKLAKECSSLPVLDDRDANEILGYGQDGLLP
ncbi:MAG: hypothetical protein HZA67_07455 [Rhodospirillales bacterium]|jgi:hypothetical protein|nr:hypothetical protein [Rhodospirillales bacterium]